MTEDEFTILFKKGRARACKIFRSMGCGPEDCDDLAQDMYEMLWRYRHRRNKNYTPLTLWYLTLRHVCSVYVPKYQRGESIPVEDVDNCEYIPDLTTQPESEEQVTAFIRNLPQPLGFDVSCKLYGVTNRDDRHKLWLKLGDGRFKSEITYRKAVQRLKKDDRVLEFIKDQLTGG